MARSSLKKKIFTLIMVLMIIPTLAACGKKSAPVPPPGEKTDFPRKYPSY